MNALYLVDYSNWVYRYVSTYKTIRRIGGVVYDVSTVHGFMRSLKSNPFTNINICLDGYPELSLTYLPSYKGQRLKEPNEGLVFPKRELIKFLTKYGELIGKNIKVVASAGQEADQVIASQAFQICKKMNPLHLKMQNMMRKSLKEDVILKRFISDDYKERDVVLEGYDTVVLGTTDSDMYQLLSIDNVILDNSTSGKSFNMGEYTPKAVDGVLPQAISAYKALIGDTSDNVPSLNLKMKKDELKKLINKNFLEYGSMRQFITDAMSGVKQKTKELQELADYLIKTDQLTQLSINNKVTELCFVSTPYEIYYEDYSIEDTIKKYNLKV